MAQAKRKQKFFDVNMPIINKETQLYGYDLKEFDGRTITYDLTRLLRGKGMLLKLKVKVEGDKAIAEPKELKVMPYFIRRMMRKGTNYVEDSFSAECKDAVLRIKPFLITRKKVSRAVRKALREKAKGELISYVKTKNTETLFDEIMKNQLQKFLSLKLKKIYPLSLCEIRFFAIKDKEESKKE
jgi:ribosomal protein S3AE